MTASTPATKSIARVLERLSGHLDDLAEEIHLIEHAICEDLSNVVNPIGNSIQRFQRLDFLRQSLEDIALLAYLLSRSQGGIIPPNMAQKLRLEVTRKVVSGGGDFDADQTSFIAAGDVEIF